MTSIAFIGTGAMGREMARHLLRAGHRVTVYNRTMSKTASLAQEGALVATSPALAARGAEMVIAMVGADEDSRMAWLGESGVLSAPLASNAILVESSTLSRGWVVELDHEVTSRGYRFLDCPVTGGPDGAAAGRLTLLAGGSAETLAAASPVLKAYGARLLHFGPAGAGTTYKLIVNLMGAVQAAAVAEGLLMAERAGLDLDLVVEALSSGACASPMVKYISERMAARSHQDVYFRTRWRFKDARYALDLARELGQAVPTSAVATELFQLALGKGLGDLNSSAVIEVLR